ncbi:uncharacterized protein LOC143476933 isoform X2 [Brachyhypopomus gauderio]|uniref:uncharacterized protein LOC143476933 isoform X2 n=1 Tax=Brachyhypopomus gauderio TaxID=698409 RepID=UPI004041141D
MCLLLFFVLLCAVGHKGVRVQGPSAPLVVQLGDTVMLPCYTQGPLPLEGLRVEWRKKDSESVVNIFQHGESRPDLQSPSFRGRAHFFPDEVSKGNFSILLKNVGKNDSGVYGCKVNTFHESSQILVEIEDLKRLVVTGADHAVVASVGEEVILNCSIDSHLPADRIEQVAWRHMDRDVLVLLFQDNETFPESSHESYQGRAEFFLTEIPKGNFSLKLKNVKMEDKGGFMCEVHTREQSGHTIVLLQRVVYSKTVMKIHACLILWPNICMGAAFILLFNEVSSTEVAMCSVIHLTRPLLLMKTSPYFNRLPKLLAKALKSLALPIYHFILATTACSIVFSNLQQAQTASEHITTLMLVTAMVSFIGAAILAWYGLRMHSTMVLVICNGALMGVFLVPSKQNFDSSFLVPSTMTPLIIGMILIFSVQRHFQGKPLGCCHNAVSSIIVTGLSLIQMILFVLIGIFLRNFVRAWMLPFEAIIFVTSWFSVMFVLRCCSQTCFSQHRREGYLCCAVIATVLIIAYGTLCLHYVNIHMENDKDRGGYMALTVLIHLLVATAFFKHSEHLSDFPHLLIYMFGAVGLNIVSSVTLVTELNLRAGTGSPTVDLLVVVVPFESVFVTGWLALQIYNVLIINRDRLKQNCEDQQAARFRVPQEMDVLSASQPNPPDNNEEIPLR